MACDGGGRTRRTSSWAATASLSTSCTRPWPAASTFGTLGSKPWSQLRWRSSGSAPSPGYDRHFGITEAFGIEMIPVPMTRGRPRHGRGGAPRGRRRLREGHLVRAEVLEPRRRDLLRRRGATAWPTMECAADDFRIFWDNAYCVHHLYDDVGRPGPAASTSARRAARRATSDRYFKFASTSKVTHPGSGISAIAASPDNIAEIKKRMGVGTIGYDKLNQLRHVKFPEATPTAWRRHMAKHAAILRPKFELVVSKLDEGLAEAGRLLVVAARAAATSCRSTRPRARRSASSGLAKEAGVTMTGAGATYPYKQDPARQQHPHRPHAAPARRAGRRHGRVRVLRETGLRGETAGLGCAEGTAPRRAPSPSIPLGDPAPVPGRLASAASHAPRGPSTLGRRYPGSLALLYRCSFRRIGRFQRRGRFGAAGAPGLPALPKAPGTSGAPDAPDAPGKACVVGRFAPHAEQTSAEGSFVSPHFGHVLSSVTAAGLKHMSAFLLDRYRLACIDHRFTSLCRAGIRRAWARTPRGRTAGTEWCREASLYPTLSVRDRRTRTPSAARPLQPTA